MEPANGQKHVAGDKNLVESPGILNAVPEMAETPDLVFPVGNVDAFEKQSPDGLYLPLLLIRRRRAMDGRLFTCRTRTIALPANPDADTFFIPDDAFIRIWNRTTSDIPAPVPHHTIKFFIHL